VRRNEDDNHFRHGIDEDGLPANAEEREVRLARIDKPRLIAATAPKSASFAVLWRKRHRDAAMNPGGYSLPTHSKVAAPRIWFPKRGLDLWKDQKERRCKSAPLAWASP
jgi:hypothetical protein